MNVKSRTHRLKRITGITLLIASVSLMTACTEEEVIEEQIVRPVKTLLISDRTSANQRTFSGVSQSAQESRLSFKVNGTIAQIPVKVGDKISAGMAIATIDPSTYELQLQQAQATLAETSAASRNARSAYDRTRSLYANNNTSLGDLDAARAKFESASAQQRAARKSLELAELNVSYTRLTVDVDCVVDSIAVELNENVSNSTEVARVNCSDELEIEIAVPESIISDLSNGKKALISFDAISGKIFNGTIIEVGVGASGVGSTFPVTVLIDEVDTSLRSGLAAAVSFSSSSISENQFVLPLSSIVKRSEGTFVYAVHSDAQQASAVVGIVKRKAVELGDLQTAGVEVLGGLAKGDRVVTAGVSFMREGLLVAY